MRAASFGVPFMAVAGLTGSDVPASSGFRRVDDPYTGEPTWVVPAVRPDWAIVHVPEADARGNARIFGSPFWDKIITRAARRTIVVAERIVSTEVLAQQPELTAVPEILVEAVVHLPGGAHPTSCYPLYGIDEAAVRRYLDAAGSAAGLAEYLRATEAVDHRRDSVPA